MSDPIEHIDPAAAQLRLQETPDDVVFLDCREPFELEIASIDGAQHIPMGEIPARLAELDSAKEIVVFCHSGMRSMSVTAFLGDQGFPRAKNLVGGIDAWSLLVDPEVPRY